MSQGKKKYYTLGEAAHYLGERLESVRARVERKEIPVIDINGQQMIRRLSLDDFYHDHPDSPKNVQKIENNKRQAGQTGPANISGGSVSSQRAAQLEAQVKELNNKLKTQNKQWQSWIDKERAEHKKTNLDAQTEISNLDEEVEALKSELEQERRNRQKVDAYTQTEFNRLDKEAKALENELEEKRNETEKERADRLEAQREVRKLKDLLEEVQNEDNPLRPLKEWLFGEKPVDERNQLPSLEIKEQLETLQSELEEEKQRREESEDWVKDLQSEREGLQSELEKEQAQRESLEKSSQVAKAGHDEYVQELLNSKEQAIAQAREQADKLENEKNLLDEIRRILGSQHVNEIPDTPATDEDTKDEAQGYILDTPDGQYRFSSPFPLEEGDLELLRLVARHGELTADQIRRQTGRRRAVGDLDDLLDILDEQGISVIEVSEDRYRLDVAKLQSD